MQFRPNTQNADCSNAYVGYIRL